MLAEQTLHEGRVDGDGLQCPHERLHLSRRQSFAVLLEPGDDLVVPEENFLAFNGLFML